MSSSTNDFEKVLRDFIPKELIPPTWKFDENKTRVKNIQSLLKGGQLNMFEHAEQLEIQIGDYMCFPKNVEYFKMDPFERIAPTPMEYLSLKKKEYIHKSDLCLMFDYDEIFPEAGWQRSAADWILNECWTKMQFGDHHEMIVNPDMEKIIEEINKALDQQDSVIKTLNTSQKATFYETFSDKMPVKTVMSDFILGCMEDIVEQYPVKKYSAELSRILAGVALVMEAVEDFVRNESIHLPPLNSVPLTKPVIRLFSIDKNRFVMAHELLKTLKNCNIDVSGFEKEVNGMPKLSTFTFREVVEKVDKDVMKNLEFVKMETDSHLMFKQTPIPTYDGGYCILAVDALRDILMEMILAKRVFQAIEEKDWIHIKKFFKSIESYFDQTRGVYFIDLKDAKTIKELWENIYNTHLKQSSPSPKLKKTSKMTGSQSSHLHLAVLHCQINSLVRKVPMLLKFIHKQGACDRLSIVGCELCDGKALVEEIVEPLGSEIEEEALSSEDTKSETEESSAEAPEQTADTEEKPSQKKKKSKKSKQPTPPEEAKPKQSNACPKCERAGKFTREANEKLRLSKIEVKQLKKDLIRNQLENEEIKQKVMDKDERIRMLERLLEEKDDVIKEQAAIIEDLRRVQEKEDSQTVIDEETAKIEDVKSNLLAIKGVLRTDSPVTKCTDIVNRLIMNTKNKKTKQMAEMEMRRFTKEATEYMEAVDDRLAMIQCNQFDAAEEIPELPEFPVFSQGFRSIYENIMKSRPPVICQQLLSPSEKVSDELEDTECVICLNNMDLEDETTKCGCCKRRYHNGCIQDWLKVKMTCPTCNSGLLDEQEFPVLV
ncbi:hypothetical protein GCK72_020878 [Caenorhabditis remanei]|uniref:RING-type domain-containing protein n=1 Tax=Caenorhabditis remanei TaxID=31234 RepID=A0A6A5GGH2_CAERE|nr:hypothetical protein GCK72_020878 [Caenorhabditis remanei]KAF1754318.1 hypothetical protein GCK72_020878 [Caenorhabditis remanei]